MAGHTAEWESNACRWPVVIIYFFVRIILAF